MGVYAQKGATSQLLDRAPSISWRKKAIELTSLASQSALKTLNAQVALDESIYTVQRDRPYLIVANHLSYLDVLILSSLFPSVFVTSREIEATPFLGHFSKWGGSLFIEHRNRTRLREDISQLVRTLQTDLRVVLFPEGQTSNGSQLLPFKGGLLKSALEAGTEVLPICINYETINKEPVSVLNRDTLFWYSEMTFASHFFYILNKVHDFSVRVTPLRPFRIDAKTHGAQAAEQCRALIATQFIPIQ